MGLKRLSDVKVGEIITIGGTSYKIETSTGDQVLVQKQVAAGIFESQKRGIGSLIQGYEGAEYHMVTVKEQKKTNLTEQLRSQVKSQSLTESLRAQVSSGYAEDDIYDDYDDEEEELEDDEEEEEDDDDYYGFRGATVDAEYRGPIVDYTQAHSDAYATTGINEAKQSALTANLRAQQNQQSLFNAHTKINDIGKGIAGFHKDVEKAFDDVSNVLADYRDNIVDTRESLHGLAFEVNGVAQDLHDSKEYAYAVSDVAHNALHKVEAIERKQLEEEKKMNLQNELNAKLAQAKQQSDFQAQLNAKLNQTKTKTTGGNGTMKNLFGAFKNQFGKVEGKFAFSITTGGLALRKGITNEFVAFEPATKAITDVTGLTLDFNVPAFKLPTAAEEVKVGDIVLNGTDFGYVTKVNDGYVETIVPEKAARGSVLPTTNAIFGKAFYTVVKTLDAAGQGGFNPALLLALGDGNKDELVKMMALTGGLGGAANGAIDPTMLMLLGDNMDDLLPLMLMQQGGVAAQGFNPLMMLALKDGGSNDKLLPLMMMQQGGGQINPMMLMALGDGELDLTTLALMGGFGGQGLFGAAPTAHTHKDVKGNK